MQHTHVKRKEHTMNRYAMEEYYRDPALRTRLFRDARLERTRAIYQGFAWLGSLPGRLLRAATKQLAPRLRPSRWIARLG
jgi:hypothetical protein